MTITAIVIVTTAAPSRAATATYVSPSLISGPEVSALSTSGDNTGFLIGLGQTLGILLDTPIGVSSGGNVSVFTLPPNIGNARATIRIGSYNSGSPIFAASRNVAAGNTRNINNVFRRGCGVLSGCDYIEIITTRTRRGAAGVEIDYIEVNGEIVEVASPTPEPSTWAMMIIGFGAVAMRLKSQRRKRCRTRLRRKSQPAFSPMSNSRLWRGPAMPQIVHP